jgi:S-adenosylmethionine decarboxylase
MVTIGLELLLDLYDCDGLALNDVNALELALRQAIRQADFSVVGRTAHQFPHQGITLVLILSQSHATLHTWPEAKFATVDVYACGVLGEVKPALEKIQRSLVARFQPRTFSAHVIERGLASAGETV